MSKHVNELPCEVLEGIFYYLEDSQRLEAALVCQQWTDVLNCTKLLQGIWLHVSEDTYKHNLPDLLTPIRKYRNFRFQDVSLDRKFLEIMKSNQNSIHKLTLIGCSWKKDSLCTGERIALEKLKCLDIRSSNTILDLFSSLSNLENLIIYDTNLKDFHIKKLQDITCKLKWIKVYSGHDSICCNESSYTKYYPNKYITLNPPSTKVLSLPFVESLIIQHRKTLKGIDFNLPESVVFAISSIPGLELTKFCFPEFCRSSVALEFCRLHPSLNSLNLETVESFEDSHLEQIVHLLPHLHTIDLSCCSCIDITPLFQLKQLQVLSLHDFTFNESVQIQWTYLTSFTCEPSLSVPLFKLLPQITYIQELTLVECITDEMMWLISATLTDLKDLWVSTSYELTDSGLTGRIVPGLESTWPPVPISNLRGLTKLGFNGIHNLTEKGVVEGIQFPFLLELHIYCEKITDKIEPDLFEGNPCLKECIIE